MTKAQIHFSNDLIQLAEVLKEDLFPAGGDPFAKRVIVVPHLRLKNFLMQRFAKDPDLKVAAGIEIVNLTQAWSKIAKKNFPTALELSLFLQHSLIPMIDQEAELSRYFGKEAREGRIGPFCDHLAKHFQSYGVYGKQRLLGWQEKLWVKMEQRWTLPFGFEQKWRKLELYVFGFSFLPYSYFSHFERLDAQIYLFSPCEIFWSDFYTEKELQFLKKEVPAHQMDFFEESFDGQNRLLADWGRVGRKMFTLIEESEFLVSDHYIFPKKESCLNLLQASCLRGDDAHLVPDLSIQCYSASTPYREVEILKDYLLDLIEKEAIVPREIQVFSPDISRYASFIHAVFSDIPHQITDLGFEQVDEVAKGFSLLVDLVQKRFSVENILQLFSSPSFKESKELDVALFRKWLNCACVKWGFSKEQRRNFYLQEMSEEDLAENTDHGTWEKGLNRLLVGLGHLEGEEMPLCAIEVTEIEAFNKLFCLIHSLEEDLAPFIDETKWTIPTWLRYFACLLESYFAIDSTDDLYKQFRQLAASCDHLDQEEVSFTSVKRVLDHLLAQKTKMDQTSQLQAIHFGTIAEGAIQPSRVICLLGMEEDAFPRKEEESSLYAGHFDYRPKPADEGKYLFLQALFSATDRLLISYTRDREGRWGASTLVDELLQYIGAEVIHHPAYPFDTQYFDGTLKSYSQEQFLVAKAQKNPSRHPPLIKELYEEVVFEKNLQYECEIDIQKLFKFARHPLRYYLHEQLGVYPEWSSSASSEYLLDPLTKRRLVKEALERPLDTVLESAEKRGELPVNLLCSLAKEQIQSEVELWKEAMSRFGVKQDSLTTRKIEMQVGQYRLIGKLESFTPRGVFVKAKDCLEDRVAHLPLALILERMGISLLPLKGEEPLIIEGALESYLDYFVLANKHPSPLIPKLAKPLLRGSELDLKKGFAQVEDETWQWLVVRDGMPNARATHRNWGSYLTKLFARCDANV